MPRIPAAPCTSSFECPCPARSLNLILPIDDVDEASNKHKGKQVGRRGSGPPAIRPPYHLPLKHPRTPASSGLLGRILARICRPQPASTALFKPEARH
jgi:hypothetical protein